jgi:hypothetical protein
MHAVVVTANIPGGVNDARIANLKNNIVPMVASAAGFIAGYWLEAVGDKGMSVVMFQDEAAAKAAAPPVGTDMGEGVTIEAVEFRAVVGNA